MLEEAIVLMEVYMSAEAGQYLILKAWKWKTGQGEGMEHRAREQCVYPGK